MYQYNRVNHCSAKLTIHFIYDLTTFYIDNICLYNYIIQEYNILTY
jgi:hypothetical protein